MFAFQQPITSIPWTTGEKPTPVIVYRDIRGDRYFMIRPRQDKFDIRIVAQGVTTADRALISAKQVEMTARTLGIDLAEDRLVVLASSALRLLAPASRRKV
jgi:hypothetical protein